MGNKRWIALGIFLILGFMIFLGNVHGEDGNTLHSKKVETAPTIDGVANEAVWNEATAVTTSNGVQLKSVYNGDEVFFLAVWSDSTKSITKKDWMFDDPEWDPESSNEDSLAFNWNIDDSVANFNSDGCTVLCHPPLMRTNGATEKIDVWQWRAARSNPSGWTVDKWMDDTGRHDDDRDSGGLEDNKQELDFVDDPEDHTDVPLYWEPNAIGDDAKSITQTEIDSGETRTITEIYTNGSMKDEDGTTIPQSTVIPFYYQSRPTGSRGDIAAKGVHAGGKWTLEFSRKFTTGFSDDVRFNDLDKSYYFGIAVHNQNDGRDHNTDSSVYRLTFKETSASAEDKDEGISIDLWLLLILVLIVIVVIVLLAIRAKKK
jgi:hypothetical protein